MIGATLDLTKDKRLWDAIVIGAGPAGSTVAIQLASQSKSVLLIDKAQFPREKICGCCLNAGGVNALKELDLAHLLTENVAVPLKQLLLFDNNRKAMIKLQGSFSLSRSSLDAALITAAIERGAQFFPGASAKVGNVDGEIREIYVDSPFFTGNIAAKIVIVAEGLNGRALAACNEINVSSVDSQSRFGAGTILDNIPEFYEPGRIYMACGNHGYVGLVRLEDNRINIAAALDKDYSRESSGPAVACAEILRQCNLPVPSLLLSARWSGTNSLTYQRDQLAADRLFIVGDACGYSEPFTGEGMSWAFWSALAASRIVLQAIENWTPQLINEWHFQHNRLIKNRHLQSKIITMGLRNATIRKMSVSILSALPFLADPIMKQMNGSKLQLKEPIKSMLVRT